MEIEMEERQVDDMIRQVERLYHSVTGVAVPGPDELPHAEIPPERDPFEHVQEQMDRLGQLLGADPSAAVRSDVQATAFAPLASFWETAELLVIQIDLPGVPRAALHIDLRDGYLEVHGVRPPPQDSTAALTLRWSDSATGAFRRTINLPQHARVEDIKAELRDGVLDIRIPRGRRQSIPVPLS